MKCTYPDCGSDRYIKDGFNGYKVHQGVDNRKQSYRCLACNRTYSVPYVEGSIGQKWGHPDDTRFRVLELYHHSRKKKLSYRKIAEQVNNSLPEGARKVSHSTVRNWVLQSDTDKLDEHLAKQKPAPYTEDDAGYLI
jgi:transposase-like protein